MDSSPIDPQITDSVTQANVNVLGEAPAAALGEVYQTTAQAFGNAAHNAAVAPQQASITSQTATTTAVTTLYSIPITSSGKLADITPDA